MDVSKNMVLRLNTGLYSVQKIKASSSYIWNGTISVTWKTISMEILKFYKLKFRTQCQTATIQPK